MLDAAIIAQYQSMTHYGITGFGTVAAFSTAPKLKDVNHTNLCLMSVHEGAPGRAILVSALDNLVKGAAGQAVQNMNLMFGLDESTGLCQLPLLP